MIIIPNGGLNMNEFKNKEIKRAYIYTRVSTEEQTQGFSLEAQSDEIKKYCEYHNIAIKGEYCDAGVTGTSIAKRESFKQMLRDIKTNKDNIDAIIIWKLSRIGRNMLDLVDIVRFLEEHDIVIVSITDNIDTSSMMGRFFFYLVGAFAEMERENIISQAKNGMKKRAQEGLWNGGPAPIGYNNFKDGRGLIVNQKEAEIVKAIFDMYTNKRWGYSKICQFLNNNLDIYATKNDKSWSYSTVKQVLDNPVYAGFIRWGKQQNWSKERRKGTTNEFILVKGTHDPIISEELWERTKELRKDKKAPEKHQNMHYLLSGLAKCPECGASMVSQRSSRKRKDGSKVWYRYYCCSQWANKKAVCKPNLIKANLLEQQVVERIMSFVKNPNLPEILAKRLGKSTDIKELEKKLKSIEAKIKKLKADEDKYYEYLVDDKKLKILKEEKILEKISEINKEMEQLEREKENLSTQIDTIRNNTLNIEKITNMLQNFEAIFNNAPADKQKELLHTLIKEIRIKKTDKPEERLAEEIILHFSEIDLMKFGKEEDQKPFEVTYDTVLH